MTDGTASAAIAGETDPGKLRNRIAKAERMERQEVALAARRRPIEVAARAQVDGADDPLMLDFWKIILALEAALTDERQRAVRLRRTRQTRARAGVEKTVIDLILDAKPTSGYAMLAQRSMLDLSAEAVASRHPARFSASVLDAARRRLDASA